MTIIPKGQDPETLGQCRNISCTNLFSKVLESFLLDWSWSQIGENLRPNQYGGLKNCGTSHFLAHLWTDVLESLEDNRSCVSLISLDFSKAFNRLDHHHVLQSYARLGASTQVIGLFAAFLSGRTMRLKVGETLSSTRPVNGGAPQGSCAGVQIYSVGTDNMDEDLVAPSTLGDRSLPQCLPDWSLVEHRPRPLEDSMDVQAASGVGSGSAQGERPLLEECPPPVGDPALPAVDRASEVEISSATTSSSGSRVIGFPLLADEASSSAMSEENNNKCFDSEYSYF